jgi:hypothetical protein
MLVTLSSTRGAKWYLDSTAWIPPPPDGHVLTDKGEEQLEDLEKCWDDYNQCEATIKVHIFTTIPDSVLIKIWNLAKPKEGWDTMFASV